MVCLDWEHLKAYIVTFLRKCKKLRSIRWRWWYTWLLGSAYFYLCFVLLRWFPAVSESFTFVTIEKTVILISNFKNTSNENKEGTTTIFTTTSTILNADDEMKNESVTEPPVICNESQLFIKDIFEPGFLLANPHICPMNGSNIKLLVLVTSAPAEKNRREAIRITWGQFGLTHNIALAFVLGRFNKTFRAAVRKENLKYRDLIIVSSIDSYTNLTLKTLSMLEWASTYCPLAKRVMKTDDDVFLNIPRVMSFISDPERMNATMTIWGMLYPSSPIVRRVDSHYYVPWCELQGTRLPGFLSGPAYLLTSDAIQPLLQAAQDMPYLRLEDVFVTGLLADKVGVRRENAISFFNKRSLMKCVTRLSRVAIHSTNSSEQILLWRKLFKDIETRCETTDDKKTEQDKYQHKQ